MHEELVLEGPAHAVHVAKVVDRRPTRVDPRAQCLDRRLAQPLPLRKRQRPRRAKRMDARPEQRLVRVDVAHAGDLALIQQQRLDRHPAPLCKPPQVFRRVPLLEWLQAEPSREELLHRLRPEQQLARAEASRIDDRELSSAALPPAFALTSSKLDAHPGVRRLGVRVGEHRARHP